jgi:OFA family oxalate/formate antiporter-like MFS transporter
MYQWSGKKRGITLLAAIIAEICVGIGYAWSIFQNPLVERFGWTTSSVSIAFTLFIFAGSIAPLVGKLQQYLKTRTIILIGAFIYGLSLYLTGMVNSITGLYLTFGLGVGVGTTMVYPLVNSYMVRIYPEKKGLISGLMVASYGSGAIVLAPVGAWLITKYDVTAAFRFLGIILFILIAISSRFICEYNDKEIKEDSPDLSKERKCTNMLWQEMVKTPMFYISFSALTIGATSGLMILGHASPIVQSMMNLPAQKAAFIVGILAASNAFGRLFWGAVSDMLERYSILVFLFILSTLSFMTLVTTGSIPLFLGAIIMIELCYGGYISLIAPITAEAFGAKHLGVNYGIMFISFAIGGVIGPRVAAIIKEANNGSYRQAFFIALVLCITGLIIAVLAYTLHNRNKKILEKDCEAFTA